MAVKSKDLNTTRSNKAVAKKKPSKTKAPKVVPKKVIKAPKVVAKKVKVVRPPSKPVSKRATQEQLAAHKEAKALSLTLSPGGVLPTPPKKGAPRPS